MKKLNVAFLWHHHQPMYKNPVTGMYELPWVRLHATKDYYDMAAILDEFPAIRSNFNFVPSLLTQLAEYSSGTAHDTFLDMTLKPAENLTEEERSFILLNFFMANWDTMIYPYPRYRQLLEKRGKNTSQGEISRVQSYFKVQELRDLQVWFNLSWMDPYWKTNDQLIKSLYEKGKDFTEEEKKLLINKQLEICGMIVSKYRQLQDRGQIEVSCTPFYHPILPLICDTNTAKESMPQAKLPNKRFRQKDDAITHLRKAVEYHIRCFGAPPKGMWPAEGSVSEEVVPLFAEAGIKWIASDEGILFRSIPEFNGNRRKLYQPYGMNILNANLNIVFRDHGLSDAIGFIYSKWNSETAVADFMKKLYSIHDMISDSPEEHLVTIILDGENCWEYYSNDGWDFLRHLYQALSSDTRVQTTTISDFIEKNPPKETLKKLWAGSWINSDYSVWIGHTEDNQAWDYLYETRKFLVEHILKHPEKKETPETLAAWEKIYIAEGSDWNWWYGEDHSSSNDQTFDYLFRENLISVYELMKVKAPEYLRKVIKGMLAKQPAQQPIDFLNPKIDGKITNYFEWQSAGNYKVGHAGGSMHQVESVLTELFYGFNLENIFIRLDLSIPIEGHNLADLAFKIVFLSPEQTEAALKFDENCLLKEFTIHSPDGDEKLTQAAAKKIIELAIPVNSLKLSDTQKTIEFVILITRNGLEIERWPYESSIVIPKPSEEFLLNSWSV